jgi:hypothetical protein
MELARLQALLCRLITGAATPADADAGAAAIAADGRMDAAARLRIYADSYFYRLAATLQEDYPALAAMLGEARFNSLITDYLAAFPPARPSIFYAGRHLAEFLREAGPAWPAWMADLAALERNLIEAFHAADAIPLRAAELAAIAPEAWPAITLATHPSVRLVCCRWSVGEILRAFEAYRDAGDPPPPDALPAPAPAPVTYLVWRQEEITYFRALEAAESAALQTAAAGATFADICAAAAIALEGGEERPIAQINRMLARWLADAILIAPPPPPAP